MLLAVRGIVPATPSRRTLDAVISEPVATRWLRTSPLAESHGGAGSVPAVAAASPLLVRTRATLAAGAAGPRPECGRRPRPSVRGVARAPPPPAPPPAPPNPRTPPPATKNGAFE